MKLGARLLEMMNLFSGYDYTLPSDVYVHQALKEKRYIGGSDRRFIRSFFYDVLRQHIFLDYRIQNYCAHTKINPKDFHRLIVLLYLHTYEKEMLKFFDGERYHPTPLTIEEGEMLTFFEKNTPNTEFLDDEKAAKLNLPKYWYEVLNHQYGENLTLHMEALNTTAPLDLRVNTLKISVEDSLKILNQKGINASPTPFSPFGIRIHEKEKFDNALVTQGLMEPQDEGSQIIAMACDVWPKMRVADFCAGAGGKTLSLSLMMKNQGTIVATDVDQHRLKRAQERFRRMNLHNITTKTIDNTWIKRHKHHFDRVLVDAPCSGSGTWRRNPDLKMRVQKKDVLDLLTLQKEILCKASRLVGYGGRLIYATCSFLREENQDQIYWFLNQEEGKRFELFDLSEISSLKSLFESRNAIPSLFSVSSDSKMMQLTPLHHGTDGFFIAVLVAK